MVSKLNLLSNMLRPTQEQIEIARTAFPTISDQFTNRFAEKLFVWNETTPLAELHGSIETIPSINHDVQLEREATLSLLLNRLQAGKIKIGSMWAVYRDGKPQAEVYTGTPEEIVERLRTEWNATKPGVVNENPESFEMMTHINLAENPWPVWK